MADPSTLEARFDGDNLDLQARFVVSMMLYLFFWAAEGYAVWGRLNLSDAVADAVSA